MTSTIDSSEAERGPAGTPVPTENAASAGVTPPDTALPNGSRRRWRRAPRRTATAAAVPVRATEVGQDLAIAPNDPVIGYFQSAAGAVDITTLDLDSPGLAAMRAAGVVLVVPLVASGDLIGLLNLGPRLSERGYSTDDRQLLEALAGYAAPAIRLGQLVREQEAQARGRERLEQELKIAQLIQQQFLPTSLPELAQWELAAFYRPARTVGGDFYDFIDLPDGRLMIVVGDVTDKGVPAALVMASTHALLRATGPRLRSPGDVLARVNDLLCNDIPAHMFVTCLALVLDPGTGEIEYANAGHDLPYLRTAGGVQELRATGMPLGLMTGMAYEVQHTTMHSGDQLLLHSDGLAEAHNAAREMFGFPRVAELAGRPESGSALIAECLTALSVFSGPDHEQEDDITLVTLRRVEVAAAGSHPPPARPLEEEAPVSLADESTQTLAEFALASVPGNEREAMTRVAAAVADRGLSGLRLEQLKTAVAEATMNAIEHGNHNEPDREVLVRVVGLAEAVEVYVSDVGGAPPEVHGPEPDLELKLSGEQTARGWGLFLIRHIVDDMDVTHDGRWHTVRLTMRTAAAPEDPPGASDARPTASEPMEGSTDDQHL